MRTFCPDFNTITEGCSVDRLCAGKNKELPSWRIESIVWGMEIIVLMFPIHFLILQNSGDGDGFMSSEFQQTLGGRGMADTFAGMFRLNTLRRSVS